MPPHSTDGDREATAQFLMRLRGRGVRDLAVLRALEATPRTLFTPRKYRDLAFRELHLPIACGQSMPDPFFVARLAEAARIGPGSRLLEIGAGSGYCAAVFARLADEVLSLERWRPLAIEAALRLDALGLDNARIEWLDGLEPPVALGRFDRIVVHALVARDDLDGIARALADDGLLLAGVADNDGETRLARLRPGGDGLTIEQDCGPARLTALLHGVSEGL